MTEPTSNGNGNGGGFSNKELLIRLEGMLSAHIAQSTQQHTAFMREMGELRERQTLHAADDHAEKVADLDRKDTREQGRWDVLKYIFGTSILALVTGIGGLIVGIVRLTSVGG